MAAGAVDIYHLMFGWWSGQTGTPDADIVVVDGSWKTVERRVWATPPSNRVIETDEQRVWRSP
jgi:hypothetical protein